MIGGIEMPKYKSHKEVWALKIEKVINNPNGSVDLFFEDKTYGSINLEDGYGEKHKPYASGYYVVYQDGYKSFSPAEAFEEGYTSVLVKQKEIKDLEEMTKVQCSDGNWNFNPYMFGMANGMILALATMKGEGPKYLDKPEKWLDKEE